MTTNNLTEQWKKGELEQGWYYVKNEFGNIFISEYSKDYDFIGERVISGFFTEVSEIIEIICEVPDYLEWKNNVNGFCDEHEYNLKLSEENQRLKELLKNVTDECDIEKQKALLKINELSGLLKECREVVEFTKTIVNKHTWFDKILIKINGALK